MAEASDEVASPTAAEAAPGGPAAGGTPVVPATVRESLALVLDTDDLVEATRLARELAPWFGVVKVGLELYSAAGPDAVETMRDLGYDVFVDLKLHDIPTTVQRAARVLGSLGAAEHDDDRHSASQYEFLPSPESILEEVVPTSFKVKLFKCFLDSAVSEQVARMIAMKGATENAGELIKQLSMQYNRARQGQITSELMDLIGGVEALN